MSKKRHNFFRLCSFVLAFMLTFTNMPAVAYATDGYSADTDEAIVSENSAITEDGEIEEEEPAAPAEEPGDGDDAVLDEDTVESAEDEEVEVVSEEDDELYADKQFMIRFFEKKTDTSPIQYTEADRDETVNINDIPEVTQYGYVHDGWVTKDDSTYFTNLSLSTTPITASMDLYAAMVPEITASFEDATVTAEYDGTITNTLNVNGAPITSAHTAVYYVEDPSEADAVTVSETGVVTIQKTGSKVIYADIYAKHGTNTGATVLATVSYTATVIKSDADLQVKVAEGKKSNVYKGAAYTVNDLGLTFGVYGDTAGTYTVTDATAIITGDAKNVGTYTVSINGTTGVKILKGEKDVTAFFNLTATKTDTFDITALEVEPVWETTEGKEIPTFPFDGQAHQASIVSINYPDDFPAAAKLNIANDIEIKSYTTQACDGAAVTATQVGSYWAKATLKDTDAAKNFTLKSNAVVQKFAISSEKQMTVTCTSPVTKPYTGNPYEDDVLNIKVTIPGTEGPEVLDPSKYTLKFKLKDATSFTETFPTVVNAGTYEIDIEATAPNYITSEVVTAKIIVNGIDPTLEVTMADWVYVPNPTTVPSVIYNGTAIAADVYTAEYRVAGETEALSGKPSDVGSYVVKVTVPAKDNYNAKSAEATFQITKADQGTFTAPVIQPDWTYSATLDPKSLVSTDGSTSTGTFMYYYIKWTSDTEPTDPAETQRNLFNKLSDLSKVKNVGKYNVYYFIQGNKNYKDSVSITKLGTVTVSEAEYVPDVSAAVADWVYGNTPNQPALDGTSQGTVKYQYKLSTATEWTYWDDTTNGVTSKTLGGTYNVRAEISGIPNYKTGYTEPTTFTVQPRPVRLSVTPATGSKTYDATSYTGYAAAINEADLVSGGAPKPTDWEYIYRITCDDATATSIKNAGVYNIAIDTVNTKGNLNYTAVGSVWTPATYTINRRSTEAAVNTPPSGIDSGYTGNKKNLVYSQGSITDIQYHDSDPAFYEYSLDYTNNVDTATWKTYTASGDNMFPAGTAAGTYKVYYRISKGNNFNPRYTGTGGAPAYFTATINPGHAELTVAPHIYEEWELRYKGVAQSILESEGEATDGTILFTNELDNDVFETRDLLEAAIGNVKNWYTASDLKYMDVGLYGPFYYYVKGNDNYLNDYEEHYTYNTDHTVLLDTDYSLWKLTCSGGSHSTLFINPSVITIKANNKTLLYGQDWGQYFTATIKKFDSEQYFADEDKDLLGITYHKGDEARKDVGTYKVMPESVNAKQLVKSSDQSNNYYITNDLRAYQIEWPVYLVGNYLIYDYYEGDLTIEPAPVRVIVADAEKDYNGEDPLDDPDFSIASIEGLQYGESESLITVPTDPRDFVRVRETGEGAHAYGSVPEEEVKTIDGKTAPYEGVIYAKVKKNATEIADYEEETIEEPDPEHEGQSIITKTGYWVTENLAKSEYNYTITRGTVLQGNYMVTFVAGDFTINNVVEIYPEIYEPWELHFKANTERQEPADPLGQYQKFIKESGKTFGNTGVFKYSDTFAFDPDGYDTYEALDTAVRAAAEGTWKDEDDIGGTAVGAYGTFYYYVAGNDGKNTYYRYYDEASGSFKYNVWTLGQTYINPCIVTVGTNNATLLYGQSWENAFTPDIQVLAGVKPATLKEMADDAAFKMNKEEGSNIGTYQVTPMLIKQESAVCNDPYYLDDTTLATEYTHPTWWIGDSYLIKDYIPATLTIEPAILTITSVDSEKTYHEADPTEFTYKVDGMVTADLDSTGKMPDPFDLAGVQRPTIIRTDAKPGNYNDPGELVIVDANDDEQPHESVLRASRIKDDYTATEGGRAATPDLAKTAEFNYTKSKGTYLLGNYMVTFVAGDFTINYGKVVVTTWPEGRDLTYSGIAQDLVTTPVIDAEYGKFMYLKVESGKEIPDDAVFTPTIPTYTNASSWDIYYYVDGTDNKYKDTEVQVLQTVINKKQADVLTAPALVSGLVYDYEYEESADKTTRTRIDKPYTLITAGTPINDEATPTVTGKMMYAAVPQGAEPQDTDYSEALPVNKVAGKWDIYYYVKAIDDNHSDSKLYQLKDPAVIAIKPNVDIDADSKELANAFTKSYYELTSRVKDHEEDGPVTFTIVPDNALGCKIIKDSEYNFDNEWVLLTGSQTGKFNIKIVENDPSDPKYNPSIETKEATVAVVIKGQNQGGGEGEGGDISEDGVISVSFADADINEEGLGLYIFRAAAIKPKLRVSNGTKTLVQGKDYTLTYKNNTNVYVGTNKKKLPTVTITGKGNYSGKKNINFLIYPKALDNDDLLQDYYTDEVPELFVGNTVVAYGKKFNPVLTYNGKVLTYGKDYTCEKMVVTNPGTQITIQGLFNEATGTGNYVGTVKVTPTVLTTETKKAFTVKVDKSSINFTYDGQPKTLEIGKQLIVVDKTFKNALVEGKDFNVSYSNNVKAGTVNVTVTGAGEYKGKVKAKFTIKPATNASVEIENREELSDPEGFPYRRIGVTPDVWVTADPTGGDDFRSLVLGVDYKVSYINNKALSTPDKPAKYKITFLGNYKGHAPITGNFIITKAEMSLDELVTKISVRETYVYNEKKPKASSYLPKAGKALFVEQDGVLLNSSEYSVKYYGYDSEGKQIELVSSKSLASQVKFVEYEEGREATVLLVGVTPNPKNKNYILTETKELTEEYVVFKGATSAVNISSAKLSVVTRAVYDEKGYLIGGHKAVNPAYTGAEILMALDKTDMDSPYAIKMVVKEGKKNVTYYSDMPVVLTVDGVDKPYDFKELFGVSLVNNVRKGTARIMVTAGEDGFTGTAVGKFKITSYSLKNLIQTWFDVDFDD